MIKISSIKKHRSLFKTILVPVIFELCGIIPLILVGLGLVSVSSGIALRDILVNQYFYIFYILSAVFFGYSIYLYLKGKNSCTISGFKRNQKTIILVFILITLLEGILLLVLQSMENYLYGEPQTHIKDFLSVTLSWWGIFIIFLLFLKLKKKND